MRNGFVFPALIVLCLVLGTGPAKAVSSYNCPNDMVAVDIHYCIGADKNHKSTWFQNQWWDLEETRGIFVKLKQANTQVEQYFPAVDLDLSADRNPDAAVAFKIEHYFNDIWESNYLALYALNQHSPQSEDSINKQIGNGDGLNFDKLDTSVKDAYFAEKWILRQDGWLWITDTGRRVFNYYLQHQNRICADGTN